MKDAEINIKDLVVTVRPVAGDKLRVIGATRYGVQVEKWQKSMLEEFYQPSMRLAYQQKIDGVAA